MSVASSGVVFLLDVDNTLLDNDRIIADLRQHLQREFGAASAERYWTIFEQLRAELGYVDYLGALQRYRDAIDHDGDRDHRLLEMSNFLLDYPFAERLYPRALAVVAHLATLGATVILSDGDVVFQPRKVWRSGLWDAVQGRVLIYVHKEHELDDVETRFPAKHYVMIDDKVRLLTAIKKFWGPRVTTIFPRQGHYALNAAEVAKYPRPDITIERIGELMDYTFDELRAAAQ